MAQQELKRRKAAATAAGAAAANGDVKVSEFAHEHDLGRAVDADAVKA